MTETREALPVEQGTNYHKAQVRSSHVHFTSTYPQKLCTSRIRPPQEPLVGLLRPWERKEGGRLRSSLLWKENEHNLVDLVEGSVQWGPFSCLFLSSVVCCQVVASSATVRGGRGERPPKSKGPCNGRSESRR